MVSVITTDECEMCDKVDTLHLTGIVMKRSIENNSTGMGSYTVRHSDHIRHIFYNEDGDYMGDVLQPT